MSAKLYVWEQSGGLSRSWDVPEDLWARAMAFFAFGKFCGGWSPFGRLNRKARLRAEEGVKRAKELYNIDVEIVYGPPPTLEQELEPKDVKLTYLDPTQVVATKQTEVPPQRTRSGYGSKLPTSWMLQLKSESGQLHWHRVYVIQYSNAGTPYILVKRRKLYLGSYEPGERKSPMSRSEEVDEFLRKRGVTTTAKEVFEGKESALLAFLIYKRMGRDMALAHAKWKALLGNNCTEQDYADLVSYGRQINISHKSLESHG